MKKWESETPGPPPSEGVEDKAAFKLCRKLEGLEWSLMRLKSRLKYSDDPLQPSELEEVQRIAEKLKVWVLLHTRHCEED